jgi:chromosome segregation ATPase
MRCVSTINKLQLELSNTKDEMKLLRKAMETLEGGYQDINVGEEDVEGMITIVGSRTIKDHKQFLTSNEMDRWQQSLNTLEEEKLMMMNDFNEKLKSLL